MNPVLSLRKGHYLAQTATIVDTSGLIIGATSYSKDTVNAQRHYHENAHISFVLNGGSVEKRAGKETERLPGNIEFYPAGEIHQTITKTDITRNIVLEMDPGFLLEYGITEQMTGEAITRNPDGKFLLLKMYKEIMANDNFSAAALHMLFIDLVSKPVNEKESKTIPRWIKVISDLLNERWNEKLTLQDLADATDLNPVTISKQFGRYFSCTFGEYMRKLKVERSLQYLKTTSTSLSDAAYHCNFADQSHFTRTFKSLTGFLPKEYQKL